jgi:apolipoprotein N-acyltransferase
VRLLDLLARLKDRTTAVRGWKRAVLALLLGALTTLALPPVHAIPVLLITLPGLVWLLDGTKGWRGAFGVGWVFGLGHFATGFYWIANALLIDPERFGWMIPFAIGGLGGLIALFLASATTLARLAGTSGPARLLALAAAWGALEWVRGWAFTGFPWNPVASVWMPVVSMLQATSVVGTYGLGMVTILAFAAPALLGDAVGRDRSRGLKTAGIAWGLLVAVAAFGGLRLAMADGIAAEGPRLRIVQPNIPQIDKWKQDKRDTNLLRHIELSQAPGFSGLDAVVWPETAASFPINLDHQRRQLAARAAPPNGVLLTGAPRMSPQGEDPFQVWNSLVAVAPDGTTLDTYDKMHLVPFGEYVPLRGILPLEKITAGSTDFSFGTGPRLMSLPGLPPAGPLICYEVIFPGQIVRDHANRPAWLLNVTNDGWYGISAGPYQHWATARLRAVEEGLPLVRAANTGISGVVDAYGRIVAYQPLGTAGTVDAALPPPLPPTVYARAGNLAPLAGSAFLALCALWLNRRQRQFCDAA